MKAKDYVVADSHMVDALLRGDPIQVWEPIEDFPQPYYKGEEPSVTVERDGKEIWGCVEWPIEPIRGRRVHYLRREAAPVYAVGAVLHVREAWRTAATLDGMNPAEIARQCRESGYIRPWAPVHYEADGAATAPLESWWGGWSRNPRTPASMPAWASRLCVRVASVRGLRLDSMTDADAELTRTPPGYGWTPKYARKKFRTLWNLRHKRAGYGAEKNPWCWCYELHYHGTASIVGVEVSDG